MHNEMINLLPLVRQRALTRDYVLRLVTVGTILLTILVCVAAVLLVPTYVFLIKAEGTEKKNLATIEATASSADEKELSARLASLTRHAELLVSLEKTPTASAVLRNTLAIAHPGTALTSLVYTPATKKGAATLAVGGTAATRDALRNYQLAVQGTPGVQSATLPVSVYAKDSDLEFTISITLTP